VQLHMVPFTRFKIPEDTSVKNLLWTILISQLGCSGPPVPGEETGTDPIEDTDPWPDTPSTWSQPISIVSNGRVLAPGDTLSQASAPAGIDASQTYLLTLTNRSDAPLSFGNDPSMWMDAPGYSWLDTPPTSLAPNESGRLAIAFNPLIATESDTFGATLQIPNEDIDQVLHLEAVVPKPLRIVLVGNHGYTLISDTYGASFDIETFPVDTSSPETTLGVVWGDGHFVRYSRSGGWSSDAVYAYSSDGETWSPATVSDGGWAFSCTYGFDQFLCARGYGAQITRSDSGTVFIHESGNYVPTFILAVVATETQLIGVGREGMIATSEGFTEFETYTSESTRGEYPAISYADGTLVAVGGGRSGGYTISTSSNGGLDWTHQQWNGGTHDGLQNIVHANGRWLVQGSSGTLPRMMRSADGLNWEDLSDLGLSETYTLLGSHNGWMFGYRDDGLYRTTDGLTWTQVHSFTTEHRPLFFAAEQWVSP